MQRPVTKTLAWLLTVLALAACSVTTAPDTAPQPLPIEQSWSGTFPVAELELLPADQQTTATGYLGDAEAFARVWASFMPDQPLPEIDFRSRLVVFSRNLTFFNRTGIVQVNLSEGGAEILAIETMSAMPIRDRVAMSLAVIPRAGVRFIRTPRGESLPVSD